MTLSPQPMHGSEELTRLLDGYSLACASGSSTDIERARALVDAHVARMVRALSDEEIDAAIVEYFRSQGETEDDWREHGQFRLWLKTIGRPVARAVLSAAGLLEVPKNG